MAEDILRMQDISKSFPGVRALDGASLTVAEGEIHGLVGENGAGKSTAIKVLAGVYSVDAGRIFIGGEELTAITPTSVHQAGVRFIHQELHLVPHFSVWESVFMGQELSGPTGLRRREMRRRTERFFRESLGTEIDGTKLIRELSTDERKLVQIARALIDDQARLVVFDEPTAPLDSGEIDKLFNAIRRLKSRGISMIYVSHYLSEITDICDRVTVFRNGKTVARFDQVSRDSADDLITAMVGRELSGLYPDHRGNPGTPILSAHGLSDGAHFDDVDLDLHQGEIIGVAGLIGSGRKELIEALYGLRKIRSGTLEVAGRSLKLSSPADAVSRGVVLVPRDRRHDGLVLPMNVQENINLASLDKVSAYGWELRKAAGDRAEGLIADLDIRPTNPEAITRTLSGGNQQKVVLGRWLATDAKVFILDEPTVGVDVGAKVEIYQLIARLAKRGAGIVISSSDPGELVGLCDRILVMMRGEIIFASKGEDLGIDQLVAMTTGAATQPEVSHGG
ncbi:MAG: sugar ABC transporter ATP-binding protein [Pseudomonadota bacterium]